MPETLALLAQSNQAGSPAEQAPGQSLLKAPPRQLKQGYHLFERSFTMATVTVLKFPTADGAANVLNLVKDLQKQQLIKVHDAAIVSWEKGKKSPKTRQLVDLVSMGAMSGMFWGMLLGLIFATPLFGMAIGATFGALGGAFRDYGIDDDFVKRVRTQVTEGTSALFLMTSEAVLDRVADAMKGVKFEIIATNLSKDQETKLREAFAHE
jgi:uncharacterized membrane protein